MLKTVSDILPRLNVVGFWGQAGIANSVSLTSPSPRVDAPTQIQRFGSLGLVETAMRILLLLLQTLKAPDYFWNRFYAIANDLLQPYTNCQRANVACCYINNYNQKVLKSQDLSASTDAENHSSTPDSYNRGLKLVGFLIQEIVNSLLLIYLSNKGTTQSGGD